MIVGGLCVEYLLGACILIYESFGALLKPVKPRNKRRAWDSNPRAGINRQLDFECFTPSEKPSKIKINKYIL